MRKPILLSPFLLVLLFACHRESNTIISNLTPVASTSIPIPAGAAGALYAENNTGYNHYGSAVWDSSSSGNASAWFLNDSMTKNAGSVSANSVLLSTTNGADISPWYQGTLLPPDSTFTSSTVAWQVQGDTTTGVPAFSFIDNAVFPTITGLALPYPANIRSGLTIHFNIIGSYDTIFYTIWSQGRVLNFISNSPDSAAFSSAQLNQVVSGDGLLTVQVTLAKITPYAVSGKTYYFVKQSLYLATTAVQ